jgi:rhomboid protease GluP
MVPKAERFSFHKQYVSIFIVVINIIIFIILQLGPNQGIIIELTAFVPSKLIHGINMSNVFIAMFIHINYLHLITNMGVFFMVAYKLERKIGHSLFLILYIVSGICAFLFHAAFNLFNPSLIDIRIYGASGAIFGILGFYLILFFNKIYKNINLSHLFIYILIHLVFLTAVMVHFGGFILGIIFGFLYKVVKHEKIVEKTKMYTNWSELGHAYLSNGMFNHAIKNLKFATKINPLDTTALMDLGYCYTKMGNLNKAINTYKQIIKLEPKNDLAWSNLAKIYFELKQYNDALQVCNESLKINANSEDALDLQKKIQIEISE